LRSLGSRGFPGWIGLDYQCGFGWSFRFCWERVAVGARKVAEVHDNLGRIGVVGAAGAFPLNERQRAKQEAADIGDDGSAPGRDAVLREEENELGEEAVDLLGGGEVREIASEGGAEVGFFAELGAEEGVTEAEAGGRMNDSEAATPSGDGAMLATSGVIDRTGFTGGFRHDFL